MGAGSHGHGQRSGRGGMRAGHDSVRQPELAEFAVICQHRRLRHLSAENQHQHHRHRRSGRPGRRLPRIHQRQPHPVPHERLACCDRADSDGKGHAAAALAIDYVRRLALHCSAPGGNTPARRVRLRGCRGRRPPRRRQHWLPRTVRAAPGESAGRSGKCDHLSVAARRTLLPAGLHISRRLADGWDVDDNNAFQPSTLVRYQPDGAHITWTSRYDSSPWAVIVRLGGAAMGVRRGPGRSGRCPPVPIGPVPARNSPRSSVATASSTTNTSSPSGRSQAPGLPRGGVPLIRQAEVCTGTAFSRVIQSACSSVRDCSTASGCLLGSLWGSRTRRAELVKRYATVRPFLPMLTDVRRDRRRRAGARCGCGAVRIGGPQARQAGRGRRVTGDRVMAAAGVLEPGERDKLGEAAAARRWPGLALPGGSCWGAPQPGVSHPS